MSEREAVLLRKTIARVAELEDENDRLLQGVRLAEARAPALEKRIAILEAELQAAEDEEESYGPSLRIANEANERYRTRVADLVALLIQVVHCGGQCDPELIAKIERATQEEAGWTDAAAPR